MPGSRTDGWCSQPTARSLPTSTATSAWGDDYDLWLLFESNTPFSVLFLVGGSDKTQNFNTNVQMIDYML